MRRKSPTKPRQSQAAEAFSKPYTSKNSFPPLEVQAAGRRSNDKVRQKPRKGLIEE